MTDTVHVTFFSDAAANHLKTADLTLEELRNRILATSAKTKATLPWLKLATFGKKKTAKQSLRHDANVINITGVELDYDGPEDESKEEWIGFDQAVELVKAMGITALIYTSPSHTAATPKWRILAPTSKPSPNDLRTKLVARINGHMGTPIKKRESFTLSQGFYYGRSEENSNANHMAIILEGNYIDLRDDLYKYQEAGEYKDKNKTQTAGNTNAFSDFADKQNQKHTQGAFEAKLCEIGDGAGLSGFNHPLTEAAASYVGLHDGNPFDKEKLKGILREAITNAPKQASRSIKDITRYLSDHYLNDIIATAIRKFAQLLNVNINDFVAYMPTHSYIFIPTREPWPATSINSRLPAVPKLDRKGMPVMNVKRGTQKTEPASDWLDKNHPVEQMTWAPGEPMLIKDKLIDGGGWLARKGVVVFNLYRPSTIVLGNNHGALPWIGHIEKIYPESAKHIIGFLAHRIQHPEEKINHALVLGGNQGIGKDTILEPVKRAVGPWNCHEVSPTHMLGQFNSYLKSVILRISEARDLGEVNRYTFYEHLKTVCASPPDVHRCNEKNLREHYVLNCCSVIITTNHKTDGLYIPSGDRRTYVAWSESRKEDFTLEYWNSLWSWFDQGGDRDVASYLMSFDLSEFHAKAPPPQTEAYHAIVNANRTGEEGELADALDELKWPDAMTLDQLEGIAIGDFYEWIIDRKNRRAIPHKLESQGYVVVRNISAKDGLWVIQRRRQVIYSKADLALGLQRDAAAKLIRELERDDTATKNNPNKSTVHPFRRS